MAAYSSSAMANPAIKHAYAPNTVSVLYTGTFSASVSDYIEMVKIPNKAVVDWIVIDGNVTATAATLQIGDDAGSKTRFGTVSLSNTTQASMIVTGAGYRYSLSESDNDREAVLLLTASASTSSSGSCSINFIVHYHM